MLQVMLLLFSTFGYFFLMYILFHGRKTALYPAFFVSGIVFVGMLAGFVNALQHIYSFMYVVGFILLPVCSGYLISKKPDYLRPSFHSALPFLILTGATIYLYITMEGRFLHGYDCFSHWGKAARVISTQMRLPDGTDMIDHAAYPPGSALFIGYISNICGSSQDIWLFAQSLMLLAFWVSLLSASKNTVIQLVLALFIVPLMNYNVSIEKLWVDNLLAASTFACIACCMSLRERPDRFLLPLSVMLCASSMIKNSGVFLAIMIVFCAVYVYRKNKGAFSFRLIVLLLPFILFIVWNVFVEHRFAQITKHQISAEYYSEVLAEKSPDDLLYIANLILPIIIDPRRNHVLYLIPGYLLIMYICKKQGRLSSQKDMFWLAAGLFICYEIGILFMYVFSMPMSEVVYQNGNDYTRYNGTIVAVLLAFLLYITCSLKYPGSGHKNIRYPAWATASAIATAALVCYLLSLGVVDFRTKEYRYKKNAIAYQFALMEDEFNEIDPDEAYIIFFDSATDYDRLISRYYCRSKDIILCYDEQTAQQYRSNEPWRYYVDLANGSIHLPTETVGVPLHTRTSSAVHNNVLNTVGYLENTRFSTSAQENVTSHEWDMTGYIPARVGDVISLKNVTWAPSKENGAKGGIYWFTEDKAFTTHRSTTTAEDLAKWNPVFDENGNVIQITLPSGVQSSTRYVLIVCQDIGKDSVITVNEEIVD